MAKAAVAALLSPPAASCAMALTSSPLTAAHSHARFVQRSSDCSRLSQREPVAFSRRASQGCRKSGTCRFRFDRQTSTSVAAGCCSSVAAGCSSSTNTPGRPEASAGASDKLALSFNWFSLRCCSQRSLSRALGHATQLGEPTLVQPDPDDAWTSLADDLGVIRRAELACFELLLHARTRRRSARVGVVADPPRCGGQMVWPFQRTTRRATCCSDFSRYCLAD
eukprot:scaffold66176_cov37-Phaeocystis_antarctica.AAC.2